MSLLQRRLCGALLIVLAIAGVVATLGSCATSRPRLPGDLPSASEIVVVRLAASCGLPGVQLGTRSGLLVHDQDDRAFHYPPGVGGGIVDVVASRDGKVRIQGVARPCTRLTVRADDGGVLEVGGKRYRGEIVLAADGEGMVVLNRLPLDQYLYGVLPGEVPTSWPAAALEAQAIAARSYALYEIDRHRDAALAAPAHRAAISFDVHDDVRSQVYKGYDGEDDRARAAVDATHGHALVFADAIVHCYFHSTCGGHTADASQVLGDDFTLPLSGRPCGHCRSSKYYEWESVLDRGEAARALEPLVRKAGAQPETLGELRGIHSGAADPSGRLVTLIAEYDHANVQIPAPQARLQLGPSKLRSLACQFRTTGDRLIVRGNGWGHGVGMCQIGARELSEAGRSGEEIVGYYYPGAKVALLQD